MLNRHSMSSLSLEFAKDKLIETVKANLVTHKADYKEACAEYQKQLISILEAKLAAAKEGKTVNHSIHLARPVQYCEQYEQAISMLERSIDQTISMDSILYGQLVLDDWEWKDDFHANTTSYTSKRANLEHGV